MNWFNWWACGAVIFVLICLLLLTLLLHRHEVYDDGFAYCPCCDSPRIVLMLMHTNTWTITCKKCGCFAVSTTKDGARATWNRGHVLPDA